VVQARQRDESVFCDPSLPASATIVLTHRVGRILKGFPLTIAVSARHVFSEGLEDGLAPEFLYVRDRVSGREIARLSLGRDPNDALARRHIVEHDLNFLGKEQFLKRHVRPLERH